MINRFHDQRGRADHDGILSRRGRERRQGIDPSTSSVRDGWQGVAAQRYYDVAVEQAGAVDRALAGAELVRGQLRDCALLTGALYGALCAGVFEFLGILGAASRPDGHRRRRAGMR